MCLLPDPQPQRARVFMYVSLCACVCVCCSTAGLWWLWYGSWPQRVCVCHAACMSLTAFLCHHRQGIIFLILNYNHIKATLRAADSSAARRVSGTGTPTAAGRQQQQQQQQPPPESPSGRLGLGSSGAAAIKECEVSS